MSAAVGERRRAIIRGLRGLRDIVWLSAVLATLTEVPGVSRVRRVHAGRGEVEVEGTASPEDLRRALADAAAWIDDIRRADPDDAPSVEWEVELDQLSVVNLPAATS